jgi:O-acetyl-ADP-ribose deacetylase (regulator of RNase III)
VTVKFVLELSTGLFYGEFGDISYYKIILIVHVANSTHGAERGVDAVSHTAISKIIEFLD